MQVLQKRWDRTFSDHSYGFRPGRSAQQAVAQAQQYIAEGHGWCVDLDLEKFTGRFVFSELISPLLTRSSTNVSPATAVIIITASSLVGINFFRWPSHS